MFLLHWYENIPKWIVIKNLHQQGWFCKYLRHKNNWLSLQVYSEMTSASLFQIGYRAVLEYTLYLISNIGEGFILMTFSLIFVLLQGSNLNPLLFFTYTGIFSMIAIEYSLSATVLFYDFISHIRKGSLVAFSTLEWLETFRGVWITFDGKFSLVIHRQRIIFTAFRILEFVIRVMS